MIDTNREAVMHSAVKSSFFNNYLKPKAQDTSQEVDSSKVYSSIDERFYNDLKLVVKRHLNYFNELEKSPSTQILRSYAVAKRCFDTFAAIIGLILLSPLFLIVAIAIKLDSKGGIFYNQVRVGKNGQDFRIHKFRTMVQDAERKTGPAWAKQNDPRVTLVEEFLRKSKIDELPQLINVIQGNMSLVGPRPERPCFVERFKEIVPGYDRRHDVIPGITGLAQIRNGYDSTPSDIYRKLRYDVNYINGMGMISDLRLIAETFMSILVGKA